MAPQRVNLQLVTRLAGLYHDYEQAQRQAVLAALSQMGANAKPVVPKLTELLASCHSYYLQQAAAEGLGSIGPAACDAIPALLPLLAHSDTGVRNTVWDALGKIDAAWPQSSGAQQGAVDLVACLAHITYEHDQSCRQSVLLALSQMGANAKPAVPKLAELLGSHSYYIQQAAAEGLGHIGEAAIEPIRQLLKHPIRSVAQAAQKALEEIRRNRRAKGVNLSDADLYGSIWRRLFGG